jgi:opacity protein-like surface antigen
MRKLIFAALFFAFAAPAAFAQDEYLRGTFGVQYSHNRVDTGGAFSASGDERDGFHGVAVNGGYNFHKFVGAEVDFSHVRKDSSFAITGGTLNIDGRLTQLLGGVRLQDNRTETRFRPFARALVGVGHASADITSPTVTADDSETGFAAEVGAGLDIRAGKHVDITAISAGWNPVRLEGETTNNIKLGFGVRFRF